MNQNVVGKMIQNMEKVIVGKKEVMELAVITLLAGGHLLLEDVPGVGKTTLAKTLAKTVGCGFSRIQFTPDTLPSDVTGVSMYRAQTESFEYVKGSVMNQVILADEINRASPKTQASLLEAMEERQVTVDGNTYPLPNPFMVIATQNPIDYLGTYHLPEAQLDRFFMKVSMGYPAFDYEKEMVAHFLEDLEWKQVEAVADEATIIAMQQEVCMVKVHEDIVTYVLKLVEATRNNEFLSLGASPRATLALLQAARAAAYCENRNYVIPDDVLKVMKPVLWHRLILSTEAGMSHMSVDKVMAQIKAKTPVPVLKSSSK